jgi:hypothetical protein
MRFVQVITILVLACALAGCQYAGAAAAVGIDLDCSDFSAPVWVGDNDPHNLDADNDGWGCESLA